VSDPTRDQLEAALAASFTRANLAVYADYLQTLEDPRGEWIAFELALVRDGVTAAAQQRREELVRPFAPGSRPEVAYGFVRDLELDTPAKVTAFDTSPLAPYLRGAWLDPDPRRLRKLVEAFVRVPRPWLRRLGVRLRDHDQYGQRTIAPEQLQDLGELLGPALTARLIAATPHLETLVLAGGLAGFAQGHPALVDPPIAGVVRGTRGESKLVVTVAGDSDVLELGRLGRHHGGIVDELDDRARDAWAELRFAIDQLECFGEQPLPRRFPAATLAAVIASIDLASYYGRDFAPIAEKLKSHEGLDLVQLAGR
jgi:hypothetical protein